MKERVSRPNFVSKDSGERGWKLTRDENLNSSAKTKENHFKMYDLRGSGAGVGSSNDEPFGCLLCGGI
ncbi:hypothetical protein KY289_020731 [Solanum tuberosum]|nr:hypothetical protein KY289_020731 [Solanum tuberosum]